MSATQRKQGSDPLQLALAVALLVAIVGVLGVTNAAVRLTSDDPVSGNWYDVTFGVFRGDIPWTGACTAVAAGIGVIVALLAVLVWKLRGGGQKKHAVDRAAAHMGNRSDVARLTLKEVTRTADRLGSEGTPGVPIGETVAGGVDLYATREDVEIDVWGPRTGKTTSRAVPAVLEAPGPCVATSNKRDLSDATLGPRSELGATWLFDPQGIVGAQASFWWDPLDYVRSGPAGTEVKAESLAAIFSACATPPDSKADSYFDPEGTELVGHLLHAAALAQHPITQVHLWATDPTEAEPVRILEEAGYELSAAAVRSVINKNPKERSGIYGAAKRRVAFLTNVSAHAWITPQAGRSRRRFDPARFAASTDTLYLVSREGRGSLAALTTALAAAVCEAAETLATNSPRGRLRVPLHVVLDEVANVCRWPELPNLFSHYGSRGIYLLAILQSWAQGEEVWGQRGMTKMWSAGTVRVYGGGVAEDRFLAEMSRLIGNYRYRQTSTSMSRGHRTTSRSEGTEEILAIADLGAMPPGRAVLFASGCRPALIKPRPWYATKWKQAVEASIAEHDPQAADTLAEHAQAAATIVPERDVPTVNEVAARWAAS